MSSEDLFILQNGRCILDEDISRKMYYIKSVHPEAVDLSQDTGYTWDEAGMADLFAECYCHDTRYCPEAKSWYTYSEGHWVKDTGSLLVSTKIKEFARLMSLYCGEIQDDDRRKSYMQFISKMGDRRFRDRLLKDAADSMAVSASTFDKSPYLINCRNGTYDLETMEFREHRWEDFLTKRTAFDYRVDYPTCDRWEKFISEITQEDKEKAKYLQKAFGYSIIGTAREECMFIAHGKTTRNGKSTLLGAIQHLMGDYSTASPVGLICSDGKQKNVEAASPILANLKGKRFVTMAETRKGEIIDEQILKDFTGGEEITARNMYESAMTFLPQFTLWLSCNDLPSVTDRALFASDRLRVIEFNKHFTEEEQDKTLKDYFRTPEAMAGIFTWLVTGYFLYKREGLEMPQSMRKVVKKYELDNDIVGQFLSESIKPDPDSTVRIKTLYDTYKIWCRSNGYRPYSMKRFKAEAVAHPEIVPGTVKVDGSEHLKGVVMK